MKKLGLIATLFGILATPALVSAQSLCPIGTVSDKLVCMIPQAYGPNGLVLRNTDAVALGVAPLQNGLPEALAPLNSSIGRQAAILPLASPSSGITFSFDAVSKAFTSSNDSFGPILGERADTIGKSRMFVGFSYQHFQFDKLDGVSLDNLPTVYTQADTLATQINGGTVCSITSTDPSTSLNDCGFIRDIITTQTSLEIKLHQYTSFFTYGLTNNIDVSMAVPIQNVRMGIRTDAKLIDISKQGIHQFTANPPSCPNPCRQTSASNFRTASGIGDVIFRVKGTVSKKEKSVTALGVDVRIPSGDPLNFLGSGAAGFKPFLIWSYHTRISPHAFVGYEVNGSSKIAGDITKGTKEKLPGQLAYSVGADAWITRNVSVAFDLLGDVVFQAQKLTPATFVEPQACTNSNCTALVTTPAPTHPNLVSTSASYNVVNSSVGAKFKPFENFLVTGNVMLRMNQGGLRANTVPLVGLSYTF